MLIESILPNTNAVISYAGKNIIELERNGDFVLDRSYNVIDSIRYCFKTFLDYDIPTNVSLLLSRYTDTTYTLYSNYPQRTKIIKGISNLFRLKTAIDIFYRDMMSIEHNQKLNQLETEFDSLYLQGMLDFIPSTKFSNEKEKNITYTYINMIPGMRLIFYKVKDNVNIKITGLSSVMDNGTRTKMSNEISKSLGSTKINSQNCYRYSLLTDTEFVAVIRIVNEYMESLK